MQDIERILTDADVKPTEHLRCFWNINSCTKSITAADQRSTADANAEAPIPLISILPAHPAERPSA